MWKNKKSQIWTKKALLEYVIFETKALEFIQIPKIEQNNNDNSINRKWDQKLPYLGILTRRFEKLLLYLKLTPSNLSKCNVWCKNKNKKKSKKGYTNADLKISQCLRLHMEIC